MATVLAQSNQVYAQTTILETIQCSACAILFGVPQQWEQERREDHKTFHCPNGHSQWYPYETEAERLKRQLDAQKTSTDYYRGKLSDTQNVLRATKGVVTRKRKELARVKNGVCPCCNRSFQNLGNHMKSQHPTFIP